MPVKCYFQMGWVESDAEARATYKGAEPHTGIINFNLFKETVPKTAENFRNLCTGENGKVCYKTIHAHQIITNFATRGGDVENRDGTGGRSIYGPKFDDENFILKHDRPFLLTMYNQGPNMNASQFIITLCPTPWLDGRHVVFGEVADEASKNVVRSIAVANGSVSGKLKFGDCRPKISMCEEVYR